MFGNCITKVEGAEHCRAYKLREKSKNVFICCDLCHSQVIMDAPDLGGEMFDCYLNGVNIENSNKEIKADQAIARTFLNDTKPEFDPLRTP